jgi:hypothetical protein
VSVPPKAGQRTSGRSGLVTAAAVLLALAAGVWVARRPSVRETPPAAAPQDRPPAALGTAAKPRSAPAVVAVADATPVPAEASTAATVAKIHLLLRRFAERDTTDEAGGDALLHEALMQLTEENVADVVRSLSAEELSTRVGIVALGEWLAQSPAAAADWLTTSGMGLGTEQLTAVGLQLRSSPAAIEALSQLNPPPQWRDPVVSAAAREFADHDPGQAWDFASRIGDDALRQRTLDSIAYIWATQDIGGLMRQLGTLNDPALQHAVLPTVARAVAATNDPDLAAAWLANPNLQPEARAQAATAVGELWAAQDPEAAASWASRLTAPEVRQAAIGSVFTRWLASDRAGAVRWATQLPEGQTLLSALADADRERAAPKD